MVATGGMGSLLPGGRMLGLVLAGGLLAVALLVLHYDSSALHRALAAVGWMGLASAAAVNFAAISLCAAAWWGLATGSLGVTSFVWFRYARNAAADLLGFVPAAGELVAVREMALRGIDCPLAVASLIADLTVQLAAQLVFTAVGAALLIAAAPNGVLTWTALLGEGVLTGILAVMIAVQRWGFGRTLTTLSSCIVPHALRSNSNMLAEFKSRLRHIYSDRRQIALSITLHTMAWFTGAAEAGVILHLIGAFPGVKMTLILESLILGLRTAVFFLPGAWGAQEAAYVFVGSVLGIPPEAALALVLVKRARELVVGVPILLAGQLVSTFFRSGFPRSLPASYKRNGRGTEAHQVTRYASRAAGEI